MNMMLLQQRWLGMQPRERLLLAIAAGLLLVWLIYSLLWQPWHQQGVRWRQAAERERQAVMWMRQQESRLPPSGAQPREVEGREINLTELIPQSAAHSGITIQRLQPQDERIMLTLSPCDFATLMRWLAELEQKNGVVTQELEVAAQTDHTGIVAVNKLSMERLP
ncbi:type II secretion system protein GspM [Lonsdalea quercina]|uniref:type II secretion system protein GspM n=1 Tax=Lonsdalea quercina TaxID=71657 RepID=UPI003974E84B